MALQLLGVEVTQQKTKLLSPFSLSLIRLIELSFSFRCSFFLFYLFIYLFIYFFTSGWLWIEVVPPHTGELFGPLFCVLYLAVLIFSLLSRWVTPASFDYNHSDRFIISIFSTLLMTPQSLHDGSLFLMMIIMMVRLVALVY